MRRYLVSLLVLLVVGFAGLNVVAYNQAHAMSHFSQGSAPSAWKRRPPLDNPLRRGRIGATT